MAGGERRSAALELQSILVSTCGCPQAVGTWGPLSPAAWGLSQCVDMSPQHRGVAQDAMRRASRRCSRRQSSSRGLDERLEAILQRRRRALEDPVPSTQDRERAGAAGRTDTGTEWGLVSHCQPKGCFMVPPPHPQCSALALTPLRLSISAGDKDTGSAPGSWDEVPFRPRVAGGLPRNRPLTRLAGGSREPG